MVVAIIAIVSTLVISVLCKNPVLFFVLILPYIFIGVEINNIVTTYNMSLIFKLVKTTHLYFVKRKNIHIKTKLSIHRNNNGNFDPFDEEDWEEKDYETMEKKIYMGKYFNGH